MMDKGKNVWLSVVVPIYNAEKHLTKCIKSILCQSFEDFELLLVDDGSTDGSAAICYAFAKTDSRVKYLKKLTAVALPQGCTVQSTHKANTSAFAMRTITMPQARLLGL